MLASWPQAPHIRRSKLQKPHFITGVDEGLFSEQHLAECRNLVETSVRLLNRYIRYLQGRKAADES